MERYSYNRACRCTRCRSRGILWPILFMTVGVLILLDNFGTADFERTWPLILILIGLVKVFQSNAPAEGHVDTWTQQIGGGPASVPPEGQVQPSSGEVRNV